MALMLVNIMYLIITDMTNALIITRTPDVRPAVAYIASLGTAVSRAGMKSELVKIAHALGAADWRAVNWAALNAAHVAAVLAQIEGSPATRNKTRAAMRGIARAAWRMSLLSSDELAKINDIKPVKGSRELKGRDVEAWELAALMRACAADRSPAGRRDAALIALCAKTGARREELAKIALADMTQSTDCWTIRVIGKGNKERVLFADNGAGKALDAWMAARGDAPGSLFLPIDKAGNIGTQGLSTTAVHKVLSKRAQEAGVPALAWHDFRRTFAGALLGAGEDIATVAALMGHSDVKTTAHYDRRPAEQRRKAAAKISVPYFG